MRFRIEFLRLWSPQAISIIWSSKSSFKLRYTSFRHRQRLIPLMICSTTTLRAEIWRFSSFSCRVRHLFRSFFFGSTTVTPFRSTMATMKCTRRFLCACWSERCMYRQFARLMLAVSFPHSSASRSQSSWLVDVVDWSDALRTNLGGGGSVSTEWSRIVHVIHSISSSVPWWEWVTTY